MLGARLRINRRTIGDEKAAGFGKGPKLRGVIARIPCARKMNPAQAVSAQDAGHVWLTEGDVSRCQRRVGLGPNEDRLSGVPRKDNLV